MRQPRLTEEKETRDPARLYAAAAIAGLVHIGLFALFQSYQPQAFEIEFEPITVELVTLSPSLPPPVPAPEPAPEPKAPQIPPLEARPDTPPPQIIEPDPTPEVVIIFPAPIPTPPTPAPIIQPPEGQSSLPVQAAPTPQGDVLIPDRWRLPVGARISLGKIGPQNGSLAKSLDCLKGFKTDCAGLRKSVFAEEQLSQTDLVWMASHAHSGLSDSSLYGLSEAEIRQRLGIPTAGENGFMILPGIGIDGPLWDILHGVNKSCGYSVGIGSGGQRELQKRCDPLKPSSKDRIAFKPLPE